MTPFVDYVFGPVRPALRVLWVAVAVLLLIACANVSGLLLTRVARKRHEQSIRLALGATRGAIARLWLTETLVVAGAGGLLGFAVAYWLARGIVALAPDDLPRVGEIAVNAPVALFTLAVVVAVSLLTAVVPLLQAGRTDVTQALDGTRATSSRSALHARSALLVVQIALSVVLMVAAGLVLRSFAALTRVDLGFVPSRVLSATVQPRTIGGPPNAWIEQLLTRVRAQPGVEAAGAIYLRPLMLGPIGQGVLVRLEGQPDTREAAQSNPTLNHQIASVGYFEAMNIRLRAGRFFNDRDIRESPRVAIVADSTARRLWPGQDPIGKRISMSSFTPGAPRTMWRTVVGVVSDVRYRGLQEVQLDVYDAALQTGRPADNILVRTSGDPMVVAPALRSIARELDPGVDRRQRDDARCGGRARRGAVAPDDVDVRAVRGAGVHPGGARAVRAGRARRRAAAARVRDPARPRRDPPGDPQRRHRPRRLAGGNRGAARCGDGVRGQPRAARAAVRRRPR